MRAASPLVLVIRTLPFGMSLGAAGPNPLDDLKEIEVCTLTKWKKDISGGPRHPVNFL